MIEVLVGIALVRWVLFPCVVGTIGYYVVVKAIVLIRWIAIGPDGRDLERRRRARRDVFDW